jgi:hypothetical protein
MASLNGNNAYFEWRGQNVSAYWTGEFSREPSVDTEDVTSGAGATHIQRAPKLLDNKRTFGLAYDVADLQTYIAYFRTGDQGMLVYGPEGNASGKPKDAGLMILTGVTTKQTIDKSKVMFEVSFEQADAPTAEIELGDMF